MTTAWTRLAPGPQGTERWLHSCRFDGAGTLILSRAHIEDLGGCAWCETYPPDWTAQLSLLEVLDGARTTA